MTERRAYVCDACYKAKNPLRVFVTADVPPPRCPTHGKMRLETNKAYRPTTKGKR
jgi:hypothetical protein